MLNKAEIQILNPHFRNRHFSILQPFHGIVNGTSQNKQPFQGRRISQSFEMGLDLSFPMSCGSHIVSLPGRVLGVEKVLELGPAQGARRGYGSKTRCQSTRKMFLNALIIYPLILEVETEVI